MKLSVVIPAHDEEENIDPLVDEVFEHAWMSASASSPVSTSGASLIPLLDGSLPA